jgi:hypothetical protein
VKQEFQRNWELPPSASLEESFTPVREPFWSSHEVACLAAHFAHRGAQVQLEPEMVKGRPADLRVSMGHGWTTIEVTVLRQSKAEKDAFVTLKTTKKESISIPPRNLTGKLRKKSPTLSKNEPGVLAIAASIWLDQLSVSLTPDNYRWVTAICFTRSWTSLYKPLWPRREGRIILHPDPCHILPSEIGRMLSDYADCVDGF